MNHIELVESAKEAIDKVYSDTSVDKETTIDSLKELQDAIDEKLDVLEA